MSNCKLVCRIDHVLHLHLITSMTSLYKLSWQVWLNHLNLKPCEVVSLLTINNIYLHWQGTCHILSTFKATRNSIFCHLNSICIYIIWSLMKVGSQERESEHMNKNKVFKKSHNSRQLGYTLRYRKKPVPKLCQSLCIQSNAKNNRLKKNL